MPSTLRREDEIDKRADEMFNSHPDLQDSEKQAGSNYGAGTDQAEAYANDPNNSSQALESRESSQGRDSANQFGYSKSEQSNTSSRKIKFLKRAGPTGGVIGLIIGGLAGLSFFLSPGLLFMHISEVFSNYHGSSSRAATVRAKASMRHIINNDKVDKACSDNPGGIRCKLGTMSEKQKNRFEAAGFKFDDAKDVNGRFIIKTVEFPDGKKVSSGNAYNEYVKNNIRAASASNRAYNAAWTAASGGIRKASERLKFSLGKRDPAGENDKEQTENLEKTLNTAEEDEDTRKNKILDANREGVDKIAGKMSNAGEVACGTYSFTRLTLAAAKAENMAKYVPFAAWLLGIGGQIKDNGDIKPGTVEKAGNLVNKTASSGPKKGLTATDSQGYRIAAHGDKGSMNKLTQQYSLNGNPALSVLDNKVKDIRNLFGGGNIRKTCKAGGLAGYATCINPVGGLICAASGVAELTGITDKLVGAAFNETMNVVLPLLTNSDIDINGKDFYGVDAGNIMAIGAYGIMSKANGSAGMKPSTKSEVASFAAATNSDYAQQIAIETYDAQKTPFDMKNQYSFLGSILRQDTFINTPTSVSASLSKLFSLSSVIISPPVGAATMPSHAADALGACSDPDTAVNTDLAEIGVDCDSIGNAQFSMSNSELNMEVDDNLDYMITNNFINEDGSEAGEDNDYAKFVQYCTEQRDYDWGISGLSVVDSDEDWASGAKCVETNEKMDNFRVYYNTLAQKEAADYVAPKGGPGTGFMTFNVLGENQGDANRNDGGISIKKRSEAALNILNEKQPAVVALQEINNDEVDLYAKQLTSYERYPRSSKDNGKNGTIFYNTSVFTIEDEKKDAGVYSYKKNIGATAYYPWLKLTAVNGGGTVFVINFHPTAGGDPKSRSSQERKDAANELVKTIREKNTSGAPTVILGDYNNTPYLRDIDVGVSLRETPTGIFKAAGFVDSNDITPEEAKINNDYKSSHGSAGAEREKDKTKAKNNKIDHVYVSKDIESASWENVINENSRIASDHTPIIAYLNIPGITMGSETVAIEGEPSFSGSAGVKMDDTYIARGGPTVGATSLAAFVKSKWTAVKNVGTYRAGGNGNPHTSGRALDIMIPSYKSEKGIALGTQISNYFINNRQKYGIQLVIWRGKIWTAKRHSEGWRTMSDRGSDTANHFDHPHVEINIEASKDSALGSR